MPDAASPAYFGQRHAGRTNVTYDTLHDGYDVSYDSAWQVRTDLL